MGFSEMLWGAEKLVPAEYWCPYGVWILRNNISSTVVGILITPTKLSLA